MNKHPVSIVIVTYNSADHILNLLNSLKSVSLIEKIIVIENNSPQASKTERIIKKYISENQQKSIQFISNTKNDGFGKSCNLGAKLCDSKFILFINPDTLVEPNSIKVLYDHAVNSYADLIGGKSFTFFGKRHLTVIREPNLNIGLFEFSNLGKIFRTERGHSDFYYLNKHSIINSKNDTEVDALGGAYLMVNKSSFVALNGFDEKFFMYLEDVDLSVRAKQLGMKVVYCPHSKIKHIGGASSDNKYKIRHQAWFDSRKYYFRKHFGLWINLLIQPLYSVEELLLKFIKKI